MPIPTEQDFNDAKVDVDDLESIVNGSTTVTTRLGGDKLSVDQALSQIVVGNVTVYSAAATYTLITDWVEEAGAMYRPLPSALPIGPEAFTAANWSPVNGLNLANIEGNINSSSRPDMNDYLDNQNIADYTALISAHTAIPYSDGDGVTITNDGIFGTGSIVVSAAHGLTSIVGRVVVLDVNTYWLRDESGALNVRWYGALPSATAAVNTAACQAAIDEAKVLVDSTPTYEVTATAKVFVPAGDYSINTITLDDSVIFEGEGQANTILSHAGTGLTDLVASSVGNNVKTSIYGMWLKGNGVTNTRYGLELSGCFYSNVIQDVLVTDCQYGMYIDTGFTLTMKNCHMRANTYGCYWFDGNAAYVENTRFEGNTNYQLKMEDAKSVTMNVPIFQFAESDDACILTNCVGATLNGMQFEGNNKDDASHADLNISGSTACINGGFWTQSTLTANTTGIAIKSNLATLDMNGVMITPLSNHAIGLQLNFTGTHGQTTLSSCQLGEGGLDDSSYAGYLNYTNLGYGSSQDIRNNIPHFLAPQNRNGGIVIGNRNFQSLIGHPDNRGSYDEEKLLFTSPEHKTNSDADDHTMILDTRNLVTANITGITKGATTTFTHDGIAGEFKNGWVIVIAGIVDNGPGGDIETTFNSTSHVITVTGDATFTVNVNSSALTNVWASGGTTVRPAKQTVEVQGAWNMPFIFGSLPAYIWVESNGRLRIKATTLPTSDTDGTVVGTQT